MSAWLKRFSLHLAAAVGATGIFVAAAAVGASQTRQQVAVTATVPAGAVARSASPERKPSAGAPQPPQPSPQASPQTPAQASPQTPAQASPQTAAQASPQTAAQASPHTPAQPSPQTAPHTPTPKVNPERSVSGTIKNVLGDGLEVVGNGGREWRVTPFPGALIRLNGKAVKLDELQPGDTVTILGQVQSGRNRFAAHAITARRK